MITEKGGFRLDIVLTHSTRDPKTFSEELLLEPDFAWMQGAKLGNQTMPSTKWQARLASGAGEADYSSALEEALSFLEAKAGFFRKFSEEKGEAELVMNYAVQPDEGKVLQVSYSPAFLRQVVDLEIQLRVQGWSGQSN